MQSQKPEFVFAPIVCPRLESTAREAVVRFLEERAVYVDLVTQWKDLGHSVAPRSLVSCCFFFGQLLVLCDVCLFVDD